MFNRFAVFTTILCAAVLSSTPHLQAQKSEVKNIVLVHGAWADGSGWRGVYDNLVRDGFNVTIVQEPETSFQDDVTAVKRGKAKGSMGGAGKARPNPHRLCLHGWTRDRSEPHAALPQTLL
jgi:hypothetical protein